MKETPKVDPSKVGGGLVQDPCTAPPIVPGKSILFDPVPETYPVGPDHPYEGPLL